MTNADGSFAGRQESLPYGTMIDSSATTTRRFTSYDRSTTTKLDYAVNRYYNAAQGRFTQVDPIGMSAASLGDPQSLNLYAYCGNDPVNHVDPDGLFFKKLFKWIGKIFKWIAIAAVIAIAALTIVPGAWAGTVLAKLSIWAAKHQILASLLGLHTPQWAIINLASEAGAAAAVFWVMAGIEALNGFLQTGGGRRGGGRRARQQPPLPCTAQLTGNANIDQAARYIYAEGSNNLEEMRGIGQVFVNRLNANRREFGGQDAALVWDRLSIADDNGGSRSYNQAANNDTLRNLAPGDCDRYRTASRAASDVLNNPNRNQPGGGFLPGNDYYWFAGQGRAQGGGIIRIGQTAFRNRFRRPNRRR